jgi:hypothetical protein
VILVLAKKMNSKRESSGTDRAYVTVDTANGGRMDGFLHNAGVNKSLHWEKNLIPASTQSQKRTPGESKTDM